MDHTELFSDIANGKYTRIIVLTGAGVSTSSGIPDYRSRNGIFNKLLGEYNISRAEDIFTRYFIDRNPSFKKNPVYLEFLKTIEAAEPSPTHRFINWLHGNGWLKRLYTQNVDGLDWKVSDDTSYHDKIVEVHGSFRDDNVVLYGDNISPVVLDQIESDIDEIDDVDLVLVMGTSLQVAPFCALPNMVRKNCTRVLVDRHPENCYSNGYTSLKGLAFYDADAPVYVSNKTTSFGRRTVSLQSFWDPRNKSRGKWKNQFIIKMDCDDFVTKIQQS